MTVWMITGAARGFGREIALAAATAGHHVSAGVREPGEVDRCLQDHPNVYVTRLDVTNEHTVRLAVEATSERFGPVDVLVNNAGRGLLGAIESTTAEQLRELYELNVFAVVAMCKALLPRMRERNTGRIINIGSMGGIAAFAGTGVYASTKFAVEGLTEAMRDELRHTGIRVTVVEPGSFRTDFMSRRSMTVAGGPEFSEYDATVNSMITKHLASDGNQPGDPAAAARAIVALAEMPEPPTRLLLGADAVARAEAKLAHVALEMTAWREVSLSTDFTD